MRWKSASKPSSTSLRPCADQNRLASAHADKEISVFTKKMFDLYGVRMVSLSSWVDSAGQAQTSVYVFRILGVQLTKNDCCSHETAISPKFSQQFPNWKTKKGVANAFLEYSEFFADGDSGDEDDGDGPRKMAKYPWAQIDFYRDEEDVDEPLRKYPILPQVPAASKAHEWIGGAKMVIRAFVKAVHGRKIYGFH
jgi:hypothetical protein